MYIYLCIIKVDFLSIPRYKQSLFLTNALSYGDEETTIEAKKIFNDWMYKNKT